MTVSEYLEALFRALNEIKPLRLPRDPLHAITFDADAGRFLALVSIGDFRARIPLDLVPDPTEATTRVYAAWLELEQLPDYDHLIE